jgi:hypothetical protein
MDDILVYMMILICAAFLIGLMYFIFRLLNTFIKDESCECEQCSERNETRKKKWKNNIRKSLWIVLLQAIGTVIAGFILHLVNG